MTIYKHTDWVNYRQLKKNEIVKEGDEFLYDERGWTKVIHSIGRATPDPMFPAHTMYRRSINHKL